ncbi:hypothetical protein LIER_11465 [Lithospermum erythrorhizon]|uniref:Secreted protein n=1 Tax=Lithospermum erythrorhizon TaxID=34254 RepID=A0AAV3PSG1_LITER
MITFTNIFLHLLLFNISITTYHFNGHTLSKPISYSWPNSNIQRPNISAWFLLAKELQPQKITRNMVIEMNSEDSRRYY